MSPLLFALLAACHGTSDDTAVTTETTPIETARWDPEHACFELKIYDRPMKYWEATYGDGGGPGCLLLADTGPHRYYPMATTDGDCVLFGIHSICDPSNDPFFADCSAVDGCCERGPEAEPECTP